MTSPGRIAKAAASAGLLAAILAGTGCAASTGGGPTGGAAAMRQRISEIVAVDRLGLPPIQKLIVGSGEVHLGSRPDCALNPRLYVLVSGADHKIVAGDHMLVPTRSSQGLVVVGTLSPRAPTGDPQGRNGDVGDDFLVLDEFTLSPEASPALAAAATLFEAQTSEEGVRLSPKELEFSVCRSANPSVTSGAVQLVFGAALSPGVWLTGLDDLALPSQTISVLTDPRAPPEAQAAARRRLGEAVQTQSQVALATTTHAGNAVSAGYSRAGITAERCSPAPGGGELLCADGRRIRLRDLVPPPSPFQIFGRETPRYLRVRLNSEPSAANVFFGATRHTVKTNTALDIRAEELARLRLEKIGFEPCPYGPRWTASVTDESRRVLEISCKLRVKRGRSRRR